MILIFWRQSESHLYINTDNYLHMIKSSLLVQNDTMLLASCQWPFGCKYDLRTICKFCFCTNHFEKCSISNQVWYNSDPLLIVTLVHQVSQLFCSFTTHWLNNKVALLLWVSFYIICKLLLLVNNCICVWLMDSAVDENSLSASSQTF